MSIWAQWASFVITVVENFYFVTLSLTPYDVWYSAALILAKTKLRNPLWMSWTSKKGRKPNNEKYCSSYPRKWSLHNPSFSNCELYLWQFQWGSCRTDSRESTLWSSRPCSLFWPLKFRVLVQHRGWNDLALLPLLVLNLTYMDQLQTHQKSLFLQHRSFYCRKHNFNFMIYHCPVFHGWYYTYTMYVICFLFGAH